MFHRKQFLYETVNRGTVKFAKTKDMDSVEAQKFREKRKWQIAFRRYVIEKNLSVDYAPYFGLDIETIRKWFEGQFEEGQDWGSFGKSWQFEHVIPVAYFDFAQESELKMCWSFLNIRVEVLRKGKKQGAVKGCFGAKQYFSDLYDKTGLTLCLQMLKKLEEIEAKALVAIKGQDVFILNNRNYLEALNTYSAFEFELLNRGRTLEEVNKEVDFIKKYGS